MYCTVYWKFSRQMTHSSLLKILVVAAGYCCWEVKLTCADCCKEIGFILLVFPLFLTRPGEMMDNMLFLPKCREWINFWEISSISATLFFVRKILLVTTSLVQSRMTAVHVSVSSSRSSTVLTSEFFRRTSLMSAICGDLRSARALHSTRK